jgi:hypothetical protein
MAMTDIEPQTEMDSREGLTPGFTRTFGRLAWQGIRLPLLAVLRFVGPVARFVLSAIALLGILTSFFFEFSGAAPRFPFWLVFCLSLSCGALVILLGVVMRRLVR